MTNPPLSRISQADVVRLAHAAPVQPCPQCRPFASPGWESFPATANPDALQPLGALWLPGDDEPTLEETPLAPGVDDWSPEAPISLAHRPYNRCEVWACRHCQLPFLRYTEYGGYYIDPRIRELHGDKLLG